MLNICITYYDRLSLHKGINAILTLQALNFIRISLNGSFR